MEQAVLARGKRVLIAESEAIRSLAERLDSTFVQAVGTLLNCTGRTVTTGVGKAGAIARKIAATLASTGTPALYLHPVEGLHGDLGVVTRDDVVIAFSYSGESDEVLQLLPTITAVGAFLIAVVGQTGSALALSAQIVLDVSVEAEACPLGLAPTTSTAAMLALGDALALSAMEARGFTREDFARFHPAGALGRRLTLRVSDVMRKAEQVAVVSATASIHDVLFAITRAGAGASFVSGEDGKLLGIITDGDVRRALLRDPNALRLPAERVMNRNPLVIEGNPLAVEAFQLLQESPRRPGEVPVVDGDGKPIGMVTIKDLLRTGIVS